MTANVAITVHNIQPDRVCQSMHVPFHHVTRLPFTVPFIFGSKLTGAKSGSHVGIACAEPIAGTFVGSAGEFLVLAESTFLILTPKSTTPITLCSTLFPKTETHSIQIAEKGKSYSITVGSILMVYDLKSHIPLKTVTYFLGEIRESFSIYHSSLKFLSTSHHNLNKALKAMIVQPGENATQRTLNVDAFRPERERLEDLQEAQVLMYPLYIETATPRPILSAVATPVSKAEAKMLPLVQARPVPEDSESASKRQRT